MKRLVLAICATSLLAGCTSVPRAATIPIERIETVAAEPGRMVDISVFQPERVKGVVLFETGFGGYAPDYADLIQRLEQQGWLVLVPLNVDSRKHPDVANYAMPQTFTPRLTDIQAAARLARELAPGKPMVAVGHSYGSLFALMAIGAETKIGANPVPEIKAAVAFSSPGMIPGVMTREGLEVIDRPFLMITGDADVVPGFIDDPQSHRTVFDANDEAGQSLMIAAGGGHGLVVTPGAQRDAALAAMDDFLAAYGLGDSKALAQATACGSLVGFTHICR